MPVKPDIDRIDGFYPPDECRHILQQFLQYHEWPKNHYEYAGRQFVLPRLQTWHADEGIRYSYSNNLLQTKPWTPLLLTIRARIEAYLAVTFNAVLVNYYRNGEDYVGWHSDNEPELGEQPLIASLTLGAERRFEFKHKRNPESGFVVLSSGTLMIMQPSFQHHWLHRVPKTFDVDAGRINLTFRRVGTHNCEMKSQNL